MSDDSARENAVIAQSLSWGQTVHGVRWGRGDRRVLFIHDPGTDLDAWGHLPRDLAHALQVESQACDLPGHGLSDDPWTPEQLPSVIAELITPEGAAASKTIAIAAGASALAALQIADRIPIAGLVALSPSGEPEGIPRSPGVPKLLFAGSKAGDDLDVARRLATAGGGWAVVTAVPVDARGTGLLSTDWHQRITDSIAAFVRDCLYPRTLTPTSRAPSPGSTGEGVGGEGEPR